MDPIFAIAARGTERLGALVEAGGPVAALLIALSVFAMGLVLAKAWQFARADLGDGAARAGLGLIRAGRSGDAAARLAGSADPAARALARVLEGRRRGLPAAMVREEAGRAAEAELEALRGWLRPLEVTAALAPLLGLFGTVLGMIDAFAAMEAAGTQVDPAVLSGGIWAALVTTAVGLAVAMPAVAAFNWFDRRIERAERAVDDVLVAAFAEPLEPGAAPAAETDDDLGRPRAAGA